MNRANEAEQLRAAIVESVPESTAAFDRPHLRYVYVPKSHARALDPDHPLVVGIRGAGKSFWWHALQSPEHRRIIASFLPRDPLQGTTAVLAGHGEQNSISYPAADVFSALLKTQKARHIWKTVVLWAVCPDMPTDLRSWTQRVVWVASQPEEVARKLRVADEDRAASEQRTLILFDALDRTSDDWNEALELLKGLLQLLLELRVTRTFRAKAFVRPDMLENSLVMDFTDASKLTAARVDLSWPRIELYALAFHYFGNAPHGGQAFRDLTASRASGPWKESAGTWLLPEKLRLDEQAQRVVLTKLAGPFMGSHHTKGKTYEWLPNHLADSRTQVSPRSFLTALRAAAVASDGHDLTLAPTGLHDGLRNASKIRVDELEQDVAWAAVALRALEGQSVPIERRTLFSKWKSQNVLAAIKKTQGLKPKLVGEELPVLAEHLQRLGLLHEMTNGKINVPDVYRLGFGLKRKGGMKIVK